jgi:ribonuclease P protein component
VQRLTFTRTDRLLKASEFVRIRKGGKRIFTRRFTLFAMPNGLDHSRFGLSVGKRVGGAVVRNRVKRLLREFFRHNRDIIEDALGGHTDLFISAKSADGLKGYEDLSRELTAALKKKTI